jgi:hypothetical protein
MVSVNEPKKRKPRSPNSRYYRHLALTQDNLLDCGYTLDQCSAVYKDCKNWLDFVNAHDAEVAKIEAAEQRHERDETRYSGAW